MPLIITRPISFFDLEATGTNPQFDRIVEISICKLNPDNTRDTITYLVNPECAIPESATAIHGIDAAKIANSPTFKMLAPIIEAFIADTDLGGFNSNKFDVPMLAAEFKRAGIHWNPLDSHLVDVGVIFKRMEERTLTAAYQFYCNKTLEGAHGAEADILATVDVFVEQYRRYQLPDTMQALQTFCNYDKPLLDTSGYFSTNEKGEIIFNFGKHKGKLVANEKSYVQWMYTSATFPIDTSAICQKILALKKEASPAGLTKESFGSDPNERIA